MDIQNNGAAPERVDFSKIKTSIPIPNLIEVQRNSYERFLQMDLLPNEREDVGLQTVFNSVFPISDFRGVSDLEFVDYSIGNWECKCGNLKGLHHLRSTCRSCGATIRTDPFHAGDILCHHCGTFNKNVVTFCNKCGDPVGLQLKYDMLECQERGMTYAAPLKVTIRLTVYSKDPETQKKSVRDIKEQEVFFGEIPLMTDNGTFIINGTERVIVSQLHRSPGVFFEKQQLQGYYLGKIIPYRGSWVEFEYDNKNLLYVRIDRKRKFYGSVFLRALGYKTDEQILRAFYRVSKIAIKDKKLFWNVDEGLTGLKLSYAITTKSGETVVGQGKKITSSLFKEIQKAKILQAEVAANDLEGAYVVADVVDMSTGEVMIDANSELTPVVLAKLIEAGIEEFDVFFPERDDVGNVIAATIRKDAVKDQRDALIEIYRKLRPGDPPTVDTATQLFQGMFFDPRKYDFSRVGRMKFNIKLYDKSDSTTLDKRTLDSEDFRATIRYLLKLRKGIGAVDDIDHLGNRRVRAVGELLENQFRIGLVRMERAIKEKMSVYQEMSTAMPHDLVNAKPVMAAIREFFGSSQLSQFMDQTNPLSEITHKRRLSALGPGGLSRERAGFEVRDVHPTHYGRICPIETPEGPNIGLINSLATYARVNQYGFIESPYRKVTSSRVSDEVIYLSAMEEGRYTVAQANAEIDPKGKFTSELVQCRKGGEYILARPETIDFVDVSPKQIVSVAAALIPFLENDDANRALMGSNMQRQAVPLIQAEAPLVGTGMEEVVARDSGVAIAARRSGVVDQVDGTRIVVRATDDVGPNRLAVDIYNLLKFQRSNQSTCITQKPLVRVGDQVKKGDIVADGPSTQNGELALGRNVLVAFMPWNGYNFEDSILLSERIVRDDVFTSIHIEEFEVMARDTKLGQEEISRDIPNVGEEALKNLDEAGIVYIGAEVKAGDILVGKVTPKGESPMTPEEKLLRAIFGEKAADVRDTSLKVPPGVEGTVVEVRVFNRRGVDKDERALAIERDEIERLAKDRDDEKAILERSFYSQIQEMLMNQTVAGGLKGLKPGTRITDKVLGEFTPGQWRQIAVKTDKRQGELEASNKQFDESMKRLQDRFDSKVDKLQRGDELPPGVMKMVKVFVATKRKLQPGDKMAGRHGNKGVISRIMPLEDMPYLEEGGPVDIVLNPLGVPSRMNVGQILETHLGWAAAGLGKKIGDMLAGAREASATQIKKQLREIYGEKSYKAEIADLDEEQTIDLARNLSKGVPFASPVFDGAHEADIVEMLEMAGLDTSGQVTLVDGRTGEPFDRKVTVGYIYMLKLHHLVDDKIHARSIGPYSLVTQQPLGGKAQFGGQRFGEMEVWALEAYGAAYTLQEMLTVKSDDVAGRTKVYESIVRGDDTFEAGIPESFNVLMKEMRSLGLNVELENS